ncbi:MAG TPA: hypothetical protein VEY10_07725 [Flavisolibacter sp.]|nr:hypothetical protein [Flavisolibacter sp.]
MQKVYLLLRNNQQTGPFNLEEIIQFDLKPYDLIWIEGKSAGWYYPQEIKALHPHLSFLKQPAPPPAETNTQALPANISETAKLKNVFVSMPANKAQEDVVQKPSCTSFTDDKNEAYRPSRSKQLDTEPELKTTYAKSLEEVEAEYTSWIYKKKTKKPPTIFKKGVIAACLLVTAVFAAWWAVKNFSGSANRNEPVQVAVTPVKNEELTDSVFKPHSITTGTKPSTDKQKQTKAVITKNEPTILNKNVLRKSNTEVVLKDNTAAKNDYETIIPDDAETKEAVHEKKPEPIAEAAKEKKKKLGEKFLDLFKKNAEEKKEEEGRPAENEAGERRSVRRETALATQVTVKFEVPNDWMMGIKDAKALLTNRSTETIVKATVEVHYYNEDNELLQTKTLTFSNIGAKKTATASIPDHSFADHLDYKIISVQGAGEPFAKM